MRYKKYSNKIEINLKKLLLKNNRVQNSHESRSCHFDPRDKLSHRHDKNKYSLNKNGICQAPPYAAISTPGQHFPAYAADNVDKNDNCQEFLPRVLQPRTKRPRPMLAYSITVMDETRKKRKGQATIDMA
jgi:hypothetical protein